MTVASPVTAVPVTRSLILAKIAEAKQKNYPSGILGVAGDPKSVDNVQLIHDGQTVRIRGARSALEARAHVAEHHDGDWTIIVTDRHSDDLGTGLLAHLIWGKVRSADPWDALRIAFKANGIDPKLTSGKRDLAAGLLEATPTDGWPAAPAGVLTRSHALAAVAANRLQLDHTPLDLIAVLTWSVWPDSLAALAILRTTFGDSLTDETIAWVADSTDVAGPAVRALLTSGDVADLVPLGLVAQVLTSPALGPEDRHLAELGRARLESTIPRHVSDAALAALGVAAASVVTELESRHRAHARRVLQRAGSLMDTLEISSLAIHSDILRQGYQQRLATLGRLLADAATATRQGQGSPGSIDAIETAYANAHRHREHHSAAVEAAPFDAAVRLWRWMQQPALDDGATLADRSRRHLTDDAWADRAINDAATGVPDATLARDLRVVVEAALARRDKSERAFATSLAEATAQPDDVRGGPTDDQGTVWHLEDVLPKVVTPMLRTAPVMLLVIDGMSAAAAVEIVEDATDLGGWVEAALPHSPSRQRTPALSVLPSLTEVSRASLLCGRLTRGQQDAERRGFRDFTTQVAKVKAELFHKKGVDTTAPGALVADGVGRAIDDIDGTKLVTIVLNTIDDALDRSDPAGTTWTTDAVKHLRPLLDRAAAAGRVVVMTADHGHVVERRGGIQRSHPNITSGRSREPNGVLEDGEIEISGDRVLQDTGRAVLAVSEKLRYGPLKAGYHGGASAAEVVVPIIALLPDEKLNPLNLELLPPQAPLWWNVPLTAEATLDELVAASDSQAPSPAAARKRRPKMPAQSGPTLFEEIPSLSKNTVSAADSLGRLLIGSATYRDQRQLAGRATVTDEQVAALVDAMHSAPSGRLPQSQVATALGVSPVRLRGALAQSQQLLNVEGYGVLTIDADGQTVVLDEPLLREQFGVRK